MTAISVTSDIPFAEIAGGSLRLNLYRPEAAAEPLPAVIYVHGGGWRRGDRNTDAETRAKPLAEHGLAVLSIDYRLATDALFPAQLHDVQAAIDWVRAHGKANGLDPERIGLWGASAGAMLASLTALAWDDPALRNPALGRPGCCGNVQAVVHWYGATDFITTATRSPMEARLLQPPFERVLFSGTEQEMAAAAALASPIRHITGDAPPFLIMHGDRDRLVPLADAQAFHDALSRQGNSSMLATVAGAGHEDPAFESPGVIAMTAAFLRAHLLRLT